MTRATAPPLDRAFEAGTDGLELIVFGPHREGDAEIAPDFGPD